MSQHVLQLAPGGSGTKGGIRRNESLTERQPTTEVDGCARHRGDRDVCDDGAVLRTEFCPPDMHVAGSEPVAASSCHANRGRNVVRRQPAQDAGRLVTDECIWRKLSPQVDRTGVMLGTTHFVVAHPGKLLEKVSHGLHSD